MSNHSAREVTAQFSPAVVPESHKLSPKILMAATLLGFMMSAPTAKAQTFLNASTEVAAELTNQTPEVLPLDFHILHIQMGGSDTFNLLRSELALPYRDQHPKVNQVALPKDGRNPFMFTAKNFQTGNYRPNPGQAIGAPPVESEKDASWFQQLVDDNTNPEVLYIGGHHIPGMGFHSDNMMNGSEDFYMHSIYLPSIIASNRIYSGMQNFFRRVKIVILGGCWSLANLEPHGPNGEYLSPEQIEAIYDSGAEGRARMVGDAKHPHSLGYQRNELTTIYSGDFSNGPANEKCDDKSTGKNCAVFNAQRTLPDYGLFDGSHQFNMPYIYKHLFPNAVLVMGFHRPSPYNDVAARIYRQSFSDALTKLNQMRAQAQGRSQAQRAAIQNILAFIMDDSQPLDQRKFAIQSIRQAWTMNSVKMNRGRASGSISPAFPDLDTNGPFVTPKSLRGTVPFAPDYAPYESR